MQYFLYYITDSIGMSLRLLSKFSQLQGYHYFGKKVI